MRTRLRIQFPKFRILSFPVVHRNTDGKQSGVMHHTYVVVFYFEQTSSLLCRLIGLGEPGFDLLHGCNKTEWRPIQSNVGFLGDRLNVTFFFHSLALEGFICFLHFSRKSYETKCNEIFTFCVVFDVKGTPINSLKTKRRPLYLKTQSVPRCKHFSSRL